jgi:hypothetical protein
VLPANQFADNAATQAQNIYENIDTNDLNCSFYSPFSPRWRFSFEGHLTKKGAMKVLYEKLDEEVILRQQHHAKQDLFLQMEHFNSLSMWQRNVSYKNDQLFDHPILLKKVKLVIML